MKTRARKAKGSEAREKKAALRDLETRKAADVKGGRRRRTKTVTAEVEPEVILTPRPKHSHG